MYSSPAVLSITPTIINIQDNINSIYYGGNAHFFSNGGALGGSVHRWAWYLNSGCTGTPIGTSDTLDVICSTTNFAADLAFVYLRIEEFTTVIVGTPGNVLSRQVSIRPATPVLTVPANNATGVDNVNTTLTWSTATWANTYRVQVSAVPGFGSLVYDSDYVTVLTKNVTTTLSLNTLYYVRVLSYSNNVGNSAWSETYSFRTKVQNPASIPVLSSPANAATSVATNPRLS